MYRIYHFKVSQQDIRYKNSNQAQVLERRTVLIINFHEDVLVIIILQPSTIDKLSYYLQPSVKRRTDYIFAVFRVTHLGRKRLLIKRENEIALICFLLITTKSIYLERHWFPPDAQISNIYITCRQSSV